MSSNSVIWPFLFSLVIWGAVRGFTWPLPEWVRRGFWVTVVVLGAAPMFFGGMQNAGSMTVVSLCGGAAGAEVLITGVHLRWARFKARQLAAQQAAREAEAQAKAARREQRRQRRQARQDDDT